MKKIFFILIFFMACGDIGEQKIGYVEIVENAWSLFSDGDYQSARTEFTNALDYKVLNNISEAYIGIGWCNLYIANEFTEGLSDRYNGDCPFGSLDKWQLWSQRYIDGQYHGAHNHGMMNISNVLYLEL